MKLAGLRQRASNPVAAGFSRCYLRIELRQTCTNHTHSKSKQVCAAIRVSKITETK
jgi:urease accessory protein UreF